VVRDAATGDPLGAASVAVRRAGDSTLVAGGVSRADGAFRIEGLRAGAYYLRVSRLGYATGTVARVDVADGRPADVGAVRLAAGAVVLDAITARTQGGSPTVTSTPDKTVVSTRDMPTVTGGSATDVLRNVPGVDVDGDGKVSLRGNQNVAIQINGRPSPLTGDALTAFLKQLPANLVNRVEVVPNPSARYDPDGMGGILNVVLKQDADLGTSGGVSGGVGTGGRYNASGNLASQNGPLTLFGSYGFNRDVREEDGHTLRSQSLGGAPSTFLDQLTDGTELRLSHTVNGGGDLKLGRRDVLSSTLMLNHGVEDGSGDSGFAAMGAARDVTGTYRQLTHARQVEMNTEGTLSLKHTLKPDEHELTVDLHAERSREDQDARFATLPGPTPPPGLLGDSRTGLGAVTKQGGLQVDYTRPLADAWRLETGYKGTLRRLDNLFVVDSVFGGAVDPSKRRTNDFRYDENVQAGYALVTHEAGHGLTLQGGVRLERAATTFHLADSARAFPNDYTSVFPSAAATYRIGDRDQLHASYSKRIQRPGAGRLNPFPEAEDQYNVRVGNPRLKPEYTHSYELSYQRALSFGSATVTPFYRHTVDAVRRYRTLDPATGISTSTFANLATANSYGTDFNGQFRVGTRVSGMLGASAFRAVTDGGTAQADLSSSAFTWSARASLNLKVGPATDVQWFQNYRAASDVPQGHTDAFSMANLAVRQKVNDHATLSVRVSDPFNTMRFGSQTYGDDFTQLNTRRFNSRTVYVNFGYTFGHAPRVHEPERDQEPQQPQGEPQR
ncbi:MAG: TonB-dependent receptor, partial [Gemmatimonadetes bacterium]|nr:TonB-dependent receptor [Gemmatimonadota bacterium]